MKQISFFEDEKKGIHLLFEEKTKRVLLEALMVFGLLCFEMAVLIVHKTGPSLIPFIIGFVCFVALVLGLMCILFVISISLVRPQVKNASMLLAICIVSFETVVCYIAPPFFVTPFILFPLIVFQMARMMNEWRPPLCSEEA